MLLSHACYIDEYTCYWVMHAIYINTYAIKSCMLFINTHGTEPCMLNW